MLNKPDNEAGLRKPDAQIKINGYICEWLSLELENTNSSRASTFKLEIPVKNQSEFDFETLIDTEELNVEINIDDGKNGLTRVFLGDVDYLNWGYPNLFATLYGRDYTARFIDENTTDKYPSNTSSQIISLFADKHGLKKNIASTSVAVGSYYSDQYSKVLMTTSEWDLMMFLAQQENFDLYVDNDTVIFQPKTDTQTYYVLELKEVSKGTATSNVVKIEFKRNYTIANDISVVVHGYDLYSQKKYTQTARRRHVPTRGTKKQKYIASIPNLTQEQATQLAKNIALQLSLHEKTFDADLAGDTILTPRSVIKVTGFSPRFDQVYYPVTITKHMDYESGLTMSVSAKNHDPNTQVDIT